MKIPLHHLSMAVLALLFFISCNNSDPTPGNTTEGDSPATAAAPAGERDIDCSTIGNFLVDSQLAKKWRDDFQKVFRLEGTSNPRTGLKGDYWIDACIITGFKRFFDNNTGYDGARIHMIVTGTETHIVLVPTVAVAAPLKHQNIWAVDVPLSCATNAEFRNVNLRRAQVRTPQDDFERLFRGRPTVVDSLSSAVWFSRCVFDSLYKYLSDASNGLDGVRIYLGAYDKKYPGTEQLKPIQSTFICVVTKPGGANQHIDNWGLLQKIYLNDKKFQAGGYNHGELCPKNCPEESEP